jgi:iron(III) transport system substrate-binding protein
VLRKAHWLLVALALVLEGHAAGYARELTLYSTRETNLLEPVIADFEKASGITVRPVFVEDSLLKRLAPEGDMSSADVLMTIGLDKTTQLVNRGLTQGLASPLIDRAVPPNLRHGDLQWIALSVRPRVAMVRKESPLETIDYDELADPKWRGKLCMRSALHQNNVALVAAYLVHHGAEATKAWLDGLRANLAHEPNGKDNDVIREIAQGTCEIGIGNVAALAQLRDGREGSDWSGWGHAVKAIPTAFKGGGTHVNLTAAAIAKYAPHRAEAQQFLEFLVTPEAQRSYAAAELEDPVLATAVRDPILVEIGSFPADAVQIDQIAAHQEAAIALIKTAGFGE